MKKKTKYKLLEYACTISLAIIIRALFFSQYSIGIEDICAIGITCFVIELIKGVFK